MRSSLDKLKPFYHKSQILVGVAKGIENGTLNRMSELCHEVLGECRYSVLSGPSHAEEVVKKCPTAVVVASDSEEVADIVQNTFMNDYFT